LFPDEIELMAAAIRHLIAMKHPTALVTLALLLALGLGSGSLAAHGKKVAARVHFSGNQEGELEPCG
jgi:hypothetical protein